MYDCRHWQDGECWGSTTTWRKCELRYYRARTAELSEACSKLVRMLVELKRALRRAKAEARRMNREQGAKRWRRWR